MKDFITSLKVGFLLGKRQLQRTNKWMNGLIVLIMMITFSSLVIIPGVLVGLIEGSIVANKDQYSGDVAISALPENNHIEQSPALLATLENIPGIREFTFRYLGGASVEANYLERRNFQDLPNKISTSVVGVNIDEEVAVTNPGRFMVEGEFLRNGQSGYAVIGATLTKRYSNFSDLFEPLEKVYVGDKVKITMNGATQEFIVKGIIKTKVDQVSQRVFISESDFRRLSGRTDLNVDEIAIRGDGSRADSQIKRDIIASGFGDYAKVQTAEEAIPKFIDQMKTTFGILGGMIGAIGVIVSAITVFVVIYINAITRRKFIGILKGIGINKTAIICAYVIQSLSYAIVGSGLGIALVYGLLVPTFAKHPINFPFSDGILVAPVDGTMIKLGIMLFVTFFAGLIPSWLIVRKNTLDSILGR